MELPFLLLIVFGILGIASVFFHYIYKEKGRLTKYLAALRFASIFGILLLLINPKFEAKSYTIHKPNLAILIDNSLSITNYNGASQNVKDLVSQIKNEPSLLKQFNLRFFTFGNELNSSIDSLNFTHTKSGIYDAINRVHEIYRNQNTAIWLISDGNQNLGKNYTKLGVDSNASIYPIVVGDTLVPEDVKISNINANSYAFYKNLFPVEVLATYLGKNQVSLNLNIKQNGKFIKKKRLKFSPNKSSVKVAIELDANALGLQSYTFSLDKLPTEKIVWNNSSQLKIEVIDQQTNIAIIRDQTHPDIGVIKKAFDENRQKKVHVFTPEEFIKSDLNPDVFILFEPKNTFQNLIPRLQNKGVWIIGGPNTDYKWLNQFQITYANPEASHTQIQANIYEDFSAFDIKSLNPNRLPPLRASLSSWKFNMPHETLFFQQINGIETPNPLLVLSKSNLNKRAYLAGTGLWKWRLFTFKQNKSFESFDHFLQSLVQFLSQNQEVDKLKLSYKKIYQRGDPLTLEAQLFDENYTPRLDETLTLTLKESKGNKSYSLQLVPNANEYIAQLPDLETGDYIFTVHAKKYQLKKKGYFSVSKQSKEKQYQPAQWENLNQLAIDSGGQIHYLPKLNWENLLEGVTNNPNFTPTQKSTSQWVQLIDKSILLFLIVFFLGLEWFIRKYNGLI